MPDSKEDVLLAASMSKVMLDVSIWPKTLLAESFFSSLQLLVHSVD